MERFSNISTDMEETIYQLYESNFTAAKISRVTGMNYETVRKALVAKYGKLRRAGSPKVKNDIIVTEWHGGTQNVKVLAEKHGCSEMTIRGHLHKAGISSKKPRDDKAIIKAYENGEPLEKMAQDFCVSMSTIYSIIGERRRGHIAKNHCKNSGLREAIATADKDKRGWQAKIALEFGVSRQRVQQIWKRQETTKDE